MLTREETVTLVEARDHKVLGGLNPFIGDPSFHEQYIIAEAEADQLIELGRTAIKEHGYGPLHRKLAETGIRGDQGCLGRNRTLLAVGLAYQQEHQEEVGSTY